jgi:copper chaperone CopZ
MGVMHAIRRTIAFSLLLPAVASAEYKRVELKILGMDCATCAHGVRVAVQKVDGVESVELSLERAAADIRLRPGNRVSLDRFRQIVKGNGFEPKEAVVTAVGTVRDAGGRLSFEVEGTGNLLVVAPDKTPAEVLRTLTSALGVKAPIVFEVVGSVAVGGGVETIAISSARSR